MRHYDDREQQTPETLSRQEQQEAKTVEQLLRSGVPELVSPAGDRIELPGTVFAVLKKAVSFMARGQTVTVVSGDQEITTQKAANLLGMSRPFFVQLLESGILPFHRVGNQRRVSLRDVLQFQKKRETERSAALDRLLPGKPSRGRIVRDRNVFPHGGTDDGELRIRRSSSMLASSSQCRWRTRFFAWLYCGSKSVSP